MTVFTDTTRARVKTALTYATLAAAAIYTVALMDPYIAIIMLPFFVLGCARGKKPLTLWALAAVPPLIMVLISFVKFTIAGVPLVTFDHLFLRENAVMLAYNDWRIGAGMVLGVVIIISYLTALLRGRFTLAGFSRTEKVSVGGLAVVAVACFAQGLIWQQPMFDWNLELNKPSIRAFVKSAQIPKPQLHTLAQVQSNTVGYRGLKAPAAGLPDVFFVLQESTAHPNIIGSDQQPHTIFAPSSFAPSSMHTGKLHVHTFAGGTWRSEFSMTTQMRPQEFGSDGLYVFHQLEGRINRSVFTMLKALGYRTMVFYSVPGSFINARSFYTSIGVDEFYDPVDMGLSAGWDWKTPDSVFYKAMLEKIGNSKQPVMAMLLTISQHGPHDYTDPVADYMTRFAHTDQDYADFLAALQKRGKPAGVVAFGDHQPEFMTRFTEDRKLWYYTNYDMRCVNFACAQSPASKRGDKPLDIVLLPSLALEEFGFGLDDFSAVQRVMFKTCDDDITACDEAARLAFNGAFQQFLN